jgi:hypothetical protein
LCIGAFPGVSTDRYSSNPPPQAPLPSQHSHDPPDSHGLLEVLESDGPPTANTLIARRLRLDPHLGHLCNDSSDILRTSNSNRVCHARHSNA